MQTLHITATAEEGKIIINVPESLNGKALDITIQELTANDQKEEQLKKFREMPAEERLRILKQFEGSAKYPDTPIDKYEWYEQAGDY